MTNLQSDSGFMYRWLKTPVQLVVAVVKVPSWWNSSDFLSPCPFTLCSGFFVTNFGSFIPLKRTIHWTQGEIYCLYNALNVRCSCPSIKWSIMHSWNSDINRFFAADPQKKRCQPSWSSLVWHYYFVIRNLSSEISVNLIFHCIKVDPYPQQQIFIAYASAGMFCSVSFFFFTSPKAHPRRPLPKCYYIQWLSLLVRHIQWIRNMPHYIVYSLFGPKKYNFLSVFFLFEG